MRQTLKVQGAKLATSRCKQDTDVQIAKATSSGETWFVFHKII